MQTPGGSDKLVEGPDSPKCNCGGRLEQEWLWRPPFGAPTGTGLPHENQPTGYYCEVCNIKYLHPPSAVPKDVRNEKFTEIIFRGYTSPITIVGNLVIDAPDELFENLDKHQPLDVHLHTVGKIMEIQLESLIREYLHNRKVDAKFGVSQHALDGMPIGEPQHCLQVAITNVGRHPITVNTVGGKWRQARTDGDRFTFLPPYDLPKLLAPGDSHTEIYWKPAQLSVLTSDLEQIWVKDAVGKCWYADKKDVEDLIFWGRIRSA